MSEDRVRYEVDRVGRTAEERREAMARTSDEFEANPIRVALAEGSKDFTVASGIPALAYPTVRMAIAAERQRRGLPLNMEDVRLLYVIDTACRVLREAAK